MSSRTPTQHRRRSVPPGYCRWCGRRIDRSLYPRARSWHPHCVEEYREQDPASQRRALWERDHGVCAECGRFCLGPEARRTPTNRDAQWEADHRVPLHRGGENSLANLQTLCVPCHRAKTAREATERAERARA